MDTSTPNITLQQSTDFTQSPEGRPQQFLLQSSSNLTSILTFFYYFKLFEYYYGNNWQFLLRTRKPFFFPVLILHKHVYYKMGL